VDAGTNWGNALVKIRLFVEGGGDTAAQQAECRKGFRLLLEKAGIQSRMLEIIACGSRNATFKDFCQALNDAGMPILLVDSEEPVQTDSAWAHLAQRDGWTRPNNTQDNQAQLMVVVMETWLVADVTSLKAFFGKGFDASKLPKPNNLEQRSKPKIFDDLEKATKDCGRTRQYGKGKRSFQVLAEVNPQELEKHLPSFQRLLNDLKALL
jgi:hypothetical protein